ncbi:UbiA family prenyltransferase [Cupriavidus sp. WKF15]|uniref:UbiA family prenyltransferase n=1 Tax=Cupriavidus sp. WKF15 TaxID=3032282 RepID=UPI0023E1E4D1|nr:UbiA family prenyltransferase [Cupriavidus sp. WKF15]WER45175.1 UbiA family prenyltransferase [Cupriavidus sp. WKF15]
MVSMPLVVDLDGTLIRTDMLHESALSLLRDSPGSVLRIPLWLSRGKAVLKERLAGLVDIDPASLPYNAELLEWLKVQKAAGRKLVLCTASDKSVALAIAEHLTIFDEVMASDGVTNLAGPNKAAVLHERYGQAGFDYVGNSSADIAVWRCARNAIVVNGSTSLAKAAGGCCEVERVFPAEGLGFTAWRRVLRVHQWLKNLLLFVPMFAGHELTSGSTWVAMLLAFFSFSICASSVYIANDLLDLESDRQHPRKRFRPFASGQVPAWKGVVLAPVLLLISVALGWFVGGSFLPWLAVYFIVTCAYSLALKRIILVDCLVLALLYTLRIIAGAAAAMLPMTFWLLAFSIFLFMSLAFVKRYAELEVQLQNGKEKVHGRGYYTSDAQLIQSLGIGAGYASVLVLALYLNSDSVLVLYSTPEFMWGAVPIMLFWVSWMWMKAHRGQMHDDPLIFAVKDRASQLAGVAFAAVLAMGTVGWPW